MGKTFFLFAVLFSCIFAAGCILLNEDGTALNPAIDGAAKGVAGNLIGPFGPLLVTLLGSLTVNIAQKMKHKKSVQTVDGIIAGSLKLKKKYPAAYALLKQETTRQLKLRSPKVYDWGEKLIKKAKGE